ncbi:hypothetical protein AVEN_206513-1, partial [Araneus ventricosus]
SLSVLAQVSYPYPSPIQNYEVLPLDSPSSALVRCCIPCPSPSAPEDLLSQSLLSSSSGVVSCLSPIQITGGSPLTVLFSSSSGVVYLARVRFKIARFSSHSLFQF